MTEFSPKTQAVYDAAMNTPAHLSYEYDMGAAIRAAVLQTRKRKQLTILGVPVVNGPMYCLASDLLAIATELENAQ